MTKIQSSLRLPLILLLLSTAPTLSLAEQLDCGALLKNARSSNPDIPKANSVFEVIERAAATQQNYEGVLSGLMDVENALEADITALKNKIGSRTFKQSIAAFWTGSTEKTELATKQKFLAQTKVALKNSVSEKTAQFSEGQRLIRDYVAHVVVETLRQSLIDPKSPLAKNLTVSSMPSVESMSTGPDKVSGIAIVESTVVRGRQKLKSKYAVTFELNREGQSHSGILFSAETQAQNLYAYDVFKAGSVVNASGALVENYSSFDSRLAQVGIHNLGELRESLLENMVTSPVLAQQVSRVLTAAMSLQAKDGQLSESQRALILSLTYYWSALKSPTEENMLKTALLIQALGLPEKELKTFAVFVHGESKETKPSVERIQSQTTRIWNSDSTSTAAYQNNGFDLLLWMNINNWIVLSGSLQDVNRLDENFTPEQLNDFLGTSSLDDPQFVEHASSNFESGAGLAPDSGSGSAGTMDSGGGAGPADNAPAPVDTGSSYTDTSSNFTSGAGTF